MNSQEYWKVFLDSGIPEYYVLYNRAKKLEENDVPQNPGAGTACITLQ